MLCHTPFLSRHRHSENLNMVQDQRSDMGSHADAVSASTLPQEGGGGIKIMPCTIYVHQGPGMGMS